MANDGESPINLMLLKLEDAGWFQLIYHVLRSSNLDEIKGKIIHVYGDVEDILHDKHRCIVFFSFLAQKVLLFLSGFLDKFGNFIEAILNPKYLFFIWVKNLKYYFKHLLNGSTVTIDVHQDESAPDKLSEKFSVIGKLDWRVELDSSIKHNDHRYYAAISMMASKVSYENQYCVKTIVEDHWKMKLIEPNEYFDFWNAFQDFDKGKPTTQAMIVLDKSEEEETYVVAFRGTEPFDAYAWCSDFDISWYEIKGLGRVHSGFMKALGLQKKVGAQGLDDQKNVWLDDQKNVHWPKEIEKDDKKRDYPPAYYAIREFLRRSLSENEKAKFIVTGHSLGGALAILFPAILLLHGETLLLERLQGVYTFGQPRVGDKAFAKFMEEKLKRHGIEYRRFVYCYDIVPRLPFDDKDFMFKHFGTCYYYDRNYKYDIVTEEPDKNYFSLTAMILMRVNAFWELMRSFTIVYKHGWEYREGLLMILNRIFWSATILPGPGVAAHCPQDYVNATRLGSPRRPPQPDPRKICICRCLCLYFGRIKTAAKSLWKRFKNSQSLIQASGGI